MTRSTRPATALGALFVLTALALGGCGRKGGLDLPPQAASTQPQGTAAPSAPDNSAAGKGSALTSGTPTDEATAARGRKRPFVLDKMLD